MLAAKQKIRQLLEATLDLADGMAYMIRAIGVMRSQRCRGKNSNA